MNAFEGYDIAGKIKKKCAGCDSAIEYAKCLGIEILTYDLANLKAMYSAADRHRTIFLNSNLSSFAKEFCCFHEIGHDQIPSHRKMARSAFMREVQFFGINYMQDTTEYEANTIAAHLYIDEEEIKEYLIAEKRTIYEAAHLLHAPSELVSIKLKEMQRANRIPGNISLSIDPCFLKDLNGTEDWECGYI